MPTVVILHAAEDTLPARALAEKVRQAKLDVVLEKSGEDIREALKSANVTIALWSPRSVTQAELAENASFAKGKTKLIHATMQSAQPPAPFSNEQAVNLTGWRGEDDFPAWRELAQQVTSKAGVSPLPPPAPKPASGFFQPGVVAPQAQQPAPPPQQGQQRGQQQQRAAQQQQAPRQQAQPRPQQTQAPRPTPSRAPAEANGEKKGGANMVLIAIITFIAVAVVGGGGYWFMTNNNNAAAYASIDNDSVSALREFLAADPSDADRERAEADLDRLEAASLSDARATNTVEAWEAFLRDFPQSDEAVYAQGQIQQLRLQQSAAPPLGPDGQPLSPDAAPLTELETLPEPAPTPTPAPSGTDGPASLTPPAEETPNEEPGDAPVN
jgi:hypothetical protein